MNNRYDFLRVMCLCAFFRPLNILAHFSIITGIDEKIVKIIGHLSNINSNVLIVAGCWIVTGGGGTGDVLNERGRKFDGADETSGCICTDSVFTGVECDCGRNKYNPPHTMMLITMIAIIR